jgi:WD40 repeat protein
MNGTLLLTAFLDGKLVLWNKDTENLMEVNDTSGEQVWAIIWNPFLPYMFATRNNNVCYSRCFFFSEKSSNEHNKNILTFFKQTVLVWDNAKDQPRLLEKKFALHTSTIRDFVWISVDQFVSCSDDGIILLCHIEKDSPLKSFSHEVI